jgi:PAS domain S-box-containing protein
MKKFLQLYQRSLFFKLLVFFILAIVVSGLFSDTVIDAVVQNTVLWYKIQLYRWAIIPVLLTFFLFLILRKPFKMFLRSEENYSYINKNYRFVVDSLIEDYFFYRHEPNKPFVYLSASVTNVLGYPKSDFIHNYMKIGGELLFQSVFERHENYDKDGITPPMFELTMKDSLQIDNFFEIKETPIRNKNGEIIAVEGIARNITKYKRVELELNEREKRYQTIFEATNDGFLVIKDDKFIDCNKRILNMFECSLEEIIMHTPFHYRFSPPTQPNGKSSRELAHEKIRLALQGKPQQFEWVHLRNGKNPFPAEISLTKFTFENEDFVLSIVRDISNRQDIMNTLKEKEENFRLLFNHITLGVFHFNAAGEIIDMNPAAYRVLQINDMSETGYFISLMKPLLDNFSVENNTVKQLDLLHPVMKKKILLSISVSKFFRENEAEYLVLAEDISEKQQLMMSYCEKDNYLKEILENSRQILYKLNVNTRNYEYISSALFHILGYTPDEFYNMSADEIKSLIHPEDAAKADSIVAKLMSHISETQNEYTVEYRFKTKNGIYRWLSDKYSFISNENNTYIVGNIMDISQLKDAELLLVTFRKQFGDEA